MGQENIILDLGLDVGSTTVKVVILDRNKTSAHGLNEGYPEIIFEDYQRHHADIHATILHILEDAAAGLSRKYGSDKASQIKIRAAITGSAGLGIAQGAKLDFVQEVIAETRAIKDYDPEADVIIELGGEDAKITYLHPVPEQRMNGSCAGGTGAFIDQMAILLKTDAMGLNKLAKNYTNLYSIASRCGVFAKTDLQPLINDGAPHEDLAASIFQAVATQTIAGLACGRPIRGNVIFLGGPLYFLPELREAFIRSLKDQVDNFKTPANAQLYVAIGAALLARDQANESNIIQNNLTNNQEINSSGRTISQIIDGVKDFANNSHNKHRQEQIQQTNLDDNVVNDILADDIDSVKPLFESPEELDKFIKRHDKINQKIKRKPIEEAEGALFLGLDAGSTTIKAVLIDSEANILYQYYNSNDADPVQKAIEIVKDIRKLLPRKAIIASSLVTGYGEGLIKAALHLDDGEVETVAHYRAAEHISPGVTSIIDIGGQDMKYLTISRTDDGHGVIESISVNEACSSGCGSFLQTFAKAMNTDIRDFAKAALTSSSPSSLGSRCTVFMNSAVKSAQKEGATLSDISAGLSYSVVRNALYKVIKLRDVKQLGDNVVVQGGTFLNNAVLRAFEILAKQEVTRPEISGLMGAFGAALLAKDRFKPGAPSTLLSTMDLERITIDTEQKKCPLCPNKCSLTVSTFNDGTSFVTGNRCERGGDASKKRSELPNLFEYKYKRTFQYGRLTQSKAELTGGKYRGKIGIPRVLNMYENFPFWHTVLSRLGFEVIVSGRSDHKLFEKGMDSIASENICYPAKLVHGHIIDLIEKGVDRIFYPCITFEKTLAKEGDNDYNCPIVAFYPQVIANNVEQLRGARKANNRREKEIKKNGYAISSASDILGEDVIDFIYPFFSLKEEDHTALRVYQEFARFGVTKEEARIAVEAGYKEDRKVKDDITKETQRALDYAKVNNLKVVVLAGRPYHVDPEINHGIPEAINSLRMVVVSEDGIAQIYDQESKRGTADFEKIIRPLRVVDQWSYHSRLYKSAVFVAQKHDLQLVQLNSFGCGLDAVTTDQCAEILQAYGDIYTVLKVDEVSNLGAAKIRLRSLKAAAELRTEANLKNTQNKKVKRNTDANYAKVRPLFTKKNKKDHKIICPQMHPVAFSLVKNVFRKDGYDLDILEKVTKADIEVGLKYVNNDACYPAIMVIGQLVNAFESGKYDPENTSVIISQTGGMCRATNYVSLLRLALDNAGYGNVVVFTVSTQGLEKHPGFKVRPSTVLWAIRALFLADMLQEIILRIRPYEAKKGSVDQCYQKWDRIIGDWILGKKNQDSKNWSYKKIVNQIVKEFDNIELLDIPRKPRVGVVGEILVKFHPDANNHVLDVIENEGCESVLPGMVEFMTNKLYISEWNWDNIKRGSKSGIFFKPLATKVIDRYYKPIISAYAKSSRYQGDQKFKMLGNMHQTIKSARKVTSIGVQAGEGWLLTGEIVELIENGAPNIVCANPFACLPNHVTGRGMFQEIRRQHEDANIVSIDYDPGASEVNQLNRIKLMITTAKEAHNKKHDK